MLPVEMRRRYCGDEELGSVAARYQICEIAMNPTRITYVFGPAFAILATTQQSADDRPNKIVRKIHSRKQIRPVVLADEVLVGELFPVYRLPSSALFRVQC